ncbi:MAG: hypothetical protein V4463_05340 [Pseudomonadota bacterium]
MTAKELANEIANWALFISAESPGSNQFEKRACGFLGGVREILGRVDPSLRAKIETIIEPVATDAKSVTK